MTDEEFTAWCREHNYMPTVMTPVDPAAWAAAFALWNIPLECCLLGGGLIPPPETMK